MMMDVDFLQYVIKNRGYTVDGFISKLSMSKTTFYKKMNNPKQFTYADIIEMNDVLKFSASESHSIFFSTNGTSMQQN